MQAVYDLSQSDDGLKAADYFPLLYDILVEPVCVVERQAGELLKK